MTAPRRDPPRFSGRIGPWADDLYQYLVDRAIDEGDLAAAPIVLAPLSGREKLLPESAVLMYDATLGYPVYSKNGVWNPLGDNETLLRALSADATGQNVNTVQPWFPANGAVALDVGLYHFSGLLLLTMGATNGSISCNFGGTATATGAWTGLGSKIVAGGNTGTQQTTWSDNLTANRQVTAAAATAGAMIRVEGVARVTVAGTFIPQYTFSAAPGVTVLTKANSFFALTKKNALSTVTEKGTWT